MNKPKQLNENSKYCSRLDLEMSKVVAGGGAAENPRNNNCKNPPPV